MTVLAHNCAISQIQLIRHGFPEQRLAARNGQTNSIGTRSRAVPFKPVLDDNV